MPVLRNIKSQYHTYENQNKGILVAIHDTEVKKVKAYFKKYKGKSDAPNDRVKGHPFVLDEEHDSLKIDFETTCEYLISELQRFK